MSAFRVSTGLHVEHRRPKAGDAPREGLSKAKVGGFRGLGFRSRGSGVQGFRGSGVQGFRGSGGGSGVQGFRGGFRGSGGSGVQGGQGFRSVRGSGVQGFKV